jgi:hypothetical protein
LIHITTIRLDEVKGFHTVRNDGITYVAKKQMLMHLHLFKVFLLYYKCQCCKLYTTLLEDDVMYGISRNWFEEYCGLDDYNDDFTGVSKPVSASSNGGNVVASGDMTVQEFRHGVRCNKVHYIDLQDAKYFNLWNCVFVATVWMHHAHLVLNEKFVWKTPNQIEIFQ